MSLRDGCRADRVNDVVFPPLSLSLSLSLSVSLSLSLSLSFSFCNCRSPRRAKLGTKPFLRLELPAFLWKYTV